LKGYYFFFYKYIIFVFYLELRQAFDLFDSDKSGSISVNELKQALGAMGVNITDQEAQEMFSAIDVDSN
jgi:Ca2+-binding EF-hand superfamily protein